MSVASRIVVSRRITLRTEGGGIIGGVIIIIIHVRKGEVLGGVDNALKGDVLNVNCEKTYGGN